MNEKDKQILKDSADVIVSVIPALNIAWGLSKALYGAGLKLREQRALEWVEMVRDNPKVFTEEILKTEEFQDKFVYSIEHYIKERSEEKRKIFRAIFLGIINSNDNDEMFPIEKYINTLTLLSIHEIRMMKELTIERSIENRNNYREIPKMRLKDYYDAPPGFLDKAEAVYSLINIGILISKSEIGFGVGSTADALKIKFSVFGLKFIDFINYEN